MTVLIFIIVLAVLIFVHELGHFLAAKLSGIRVDEFSVGFPPRIFSKKYKGTNYSIGCIPFGGYVKIYGENPDEAIEAAPDSYRAFSTKPRIIQAIVLIAGVVFNWIFAWFLLSMIFAIGSNRTAISDTLPPDVMEDQRVAIVAVSPNSPAVQFGIQPGEEIIAVTANGQKETITSIEQFRSFVQSGATITLDTVYRGTYASKDVKGAAMEEGAAPALGVQLQDVATVNMNWYQSIWYGLKATYAMTINMVVELYKLVAGAVTGTGSWDQVSGPVGIAKILGDGAKEGFGIVAMFTAFISINLAIINLLPLPALDGGRLLFVIIEAILRRRISPVVQNRANIIGFALLMLLMVVITFKDIAKLW